MHRNFIMDGKFGYKAAFPGSPDDVISKNQFIRARFSEMTLPKAKVDLREQKTGRVLFESADTNQKMKPVAEEGGGTLATGPGTAGGSAPGSPSLLPSTSCLLWQDGCPPCVQSKGNSSDFTL